MTKKKRKQILQLSGLHIFYIIRKYVIIRICQQLYFSDTLFS